MLALYSSLIEISRGNTNEHLCGYFLLKFEMHVDVFEGDLSLVPSNDRSVLENLFRYNVYRSDKIVRNGLVHFMRVLLGKMQPNLTAAIYRLIESILRELFQDLKIATTQHRVKLEKIQLFLEVLAEICDDSLKNFLLSNQIDDQLFKILRQVEE